MKDRILNKISDLVADLLYYNRKEDEELPEGRIEELISLGEITIDEMVERFKQEIIEGVK